MSQGVMQNNKTKFFFAFVVALFVAFVLFVFQFFGVFTTKFINIVRPSIVAVNTSEVDNDIVLTDRNNVAKEMTV